MQGTQGTQGRMRSEVVKHVKKMWKRCEKLQQNERDMWKTYVKHVVKKLCHESRQSNSRVSIESRSPGPNCHDRSSPEGFYRRSWRSIKASTESLNDVSRLYEIIRMMLWPCDLVTLWPEIPAEACHPAKVSWKQGLYWSRLPQTHQTHGVNGMPECP